MGYKEEKDESAHSKTRSEMIKVIQNWAEPDTRRDEIIREKDLNYT